MLTIWNACKNGVKNVILWFVLGVNDRTDPQLADFICAHSGNDQCAHSTVCYTYMLYTQ